MSFVEHVCQGHCGCREGLKAAVRPAPNNAASIIASLIATKAMFADKPENPGLEAPVMCNKYVCGGMM